MMMMARPGLEPGTPRFSVVLTEPSESAVLQVKPRLRLPATDTAESRVCGLFGCRRACKSTLGPKSVNADLHATEHVSNGISGAGRVPLPGCFPAREAGKPNVVLIPVEVLVPVGDDGVAATLGGCRRFVRCSPVFLDSFGAGTSTAARCSVGATLSHMEIGVRDLRNRTSQVIDAVQAGERVTLTVHGEPVADIVPHGRRTRWLSGEHLREQLHDRTADPTLTHDLNDLAGQTLDEL
jgi:prevent-host-death family protein